MPMEINKLEPEKKHGLVVVLTGNGKGKTTSAIGMELRPACHNIRNSVIQFMLGVL